MLTKLISFQLYVPGHEHTKVEETFGKLNSHLFLKPLAACWLLNGKYYNIKQKPDTQTCRSGIPAAYVTFAGGVWPKKKHQKKTGGCSTTEPSCTPEMQVDKPLCCLRREQVIIAGILTSVCQSEGQLCLRGRSMLICSAGKDYHSPLER